MPLAAGAYRRTGGDETDEGCGRGMLREEEGEEESALGLALRVPRRQAAPQP